MNTANRTKNATYSVMTGLAQRFASILAGFLSQYAFIHYLGIEYVSIDGLFSSVLSLLSLAELGLSTSLVANLYKPLADNNIDELKSIMRYYKKSYSLMGCIIFVVGLCLLPFLNIFVNFENAPNVNIYLVYLLFLINTCLSYWVFAYKSSIIAADQKTYIINKYGIFCEIGISISKCFIVALTKNFVLALIGEMSIKMIYNICVANKANRLYPYINDNDAKPLSTSIKNKMFNDTKHLFATNIAQTLSTNFSKIVISGSIGTILIGYTYIYERITAHIGTIINMVTTSYSGSIGNLIYKEDKEKHLKVFEELHFVNYWLSCFCCVCLLCLLNPFVKLFYGNSIELQKTILSTWTIVVMVFHVYFSTVGNIINTYKTSYGILREGWQISFFGSIIIVLLDFILIPKLGLIGMYITYTITDVCFNIAPNVYYLFKLGFKTDSRCFIIRLIKELLLMLAVSFVTYGLCSLIADGSVVSFAIKMVLSVLLSNIILVLVFFRTDEYKSLKSRFFSLLKK